MAEPMLSVKGLQAWYGESHVLHGVDIHINQGEVITLLGRNITAGYQALSDGLIFPRDAKIAAKEPIFQRFDALAVSVNIESTLVIEDFVAHHVGNPA